MTSHLHSVDTDGAIREAQEELEGISRASFLSRAAVGGGTVLTSGAIMAMVPEPAAARRRSKKRDVKILNYALTLEYLEAAFYAEALSRGALSGTVLETTKLISAHESTHVSALKRTIRALGRKPVKAPSFDFKNTTADQATFLSTAFVLENTGVHAYLGQAANIKQKTLLKAAGSILTVEARHAAAIAGLIGDKPYDLSGGGSNYTPQGAFDTGWSRRHVLREVGKTGFIAS